MVEDSEWVPWPHMHNDFPAHILYACGKASFISQAHRLIVITNMKKIITATHCWESRECVLCVSVRPCPYTTTVLLPSAETEWLPWPQTHWPLHLWPQINSHPIIYLLCGILLQKMSPQHTDCIRSMHKLHVICMPSMGCNFCCNFCYNFCCLSVEGKRPFIWVNSSLIFFILLLWAYLDTETPYLWISATSRCLDFLVL